MFHSRTNHLCAVTDRTSNSFLPRVPRRAPFWLHAKRSLKKVVLVAEYNPQSRKFLLSFSAISTERKKQVSTGSWVIHPFSIFRLYYEMWMSFVFLMVLVYRPLDIAFRFFLQDTLWITNLLSVFCLIDIVVNFCTGYCLPSHEVEMSMHKIARNYVCGPYFITDLLSSLPVFTYYTRVYQKYIDYLGLLKIFRLETCMTYLDRTLRSLPIEILILTSLVVHYVSCCNFFLPLEISGTFQSSNHFEVSKLNGTENIHNDNKFFGYFYMYCVFHSVSFILGIEIPFRMDQSWVIYLFAIVVYVGGTVFTAYLTAMFVEAYSVHSSIENKYYAVMSQMGAFMQTHEFPYSLQTRVKQYYEYKYQRKYFNESKIERYISDKLRKEIKYQACHTLVQSVSFFESLPLEILEDIVTHLKKEIFLPQDVIIQAGVLGDCMYFLSSGTVAVYAPSGKEICHLRDGDYFGEICLIIPNQRATANIVALEFCELYKLERKPFKKCFESEAELYKKIQSEAKRRFKSTQDIERSRVLRTSSGLLPWT